MRANSLALRLFLTAAAWIAAILVVTGIVLSSLYREAVERAFDRRLDVYLKTLVADVASPEDTSERYPQALGEPLFELPLSGWYWQVIRLDAAKPELRASRSLWDGTLPRPPGDITTPDGTRQANVRGPEDQRLRIAERLIDFGDDGRYLLAVAGDAAEIDDEIEAFETWLMATFFVLGAVLLLTTVFQVRFGLAPLTRISESLATIRSGGAGQLEGRFPDEIAPLARETNALIDANREIVERARTHVGNLAHALKTPLSVMMNEADARPDDPFADKVREQAALMRHQVEHHLARARMAARVVTVGSITDVVPVVAALGRTMEKLHRDRDLVIEVAAGEHARFRGEQQDLEEMVGNLVDNACKWAQSRVCVQVMPERSIEAPDRPRVRIIVDDDGPGLSPAEREQASQRGQRLDETKPGSGLGLSIVTDLSVLYGGGLTLGAAPLGGLRAELVLPGV